MAYIAIVTFDKIGRATKWQEYETEADALAHVDRVQQTFLEAYAAINPGGGYRDWLCDPIAKTITFDPLPIKPPPPDLDAALDVAIAEAGTLAALKAVLSGAVKAR